MPKMVVSKSILIAKPISELYPLISDFGHWNRWSPWNILEDGVENTFADNNKYFEWVGDITGSGNMRITSEVENKSIAIDLTFLKPFKSKAKVFFELEKVDGGTIVTWKMESSMPFFLFFMVKAMTIYIGMDFDRGLLLLKDVAEDGEAHCKLDVIGVKMSTSCNYIGVMKSCTVDLLGPNSKDGFTELMEYTGAKDGLISGNAFTTYQDYNPVKNKVQFTCCVAVSEKPIDLPSNFVYGSIPAMDVYSVKMIGPYHHLGNAWSSMEMRARSKKFKKNKSVNPMEIYLNTPMDTQDNDLITEIQFAVN